MAIHLLVTYKVLLFIESDGLVLSYKLKLSRNLKKKEKKERKKSMLG